MDLIYYRFIDPVDAKSPINIGMKIQWKRIKMKSKEIENKEKRKEW